MTDRDQQPEIELLERYIAREVSLTEQELVEHELAAIPGAPAMIDRLRSLDAGPYEVPGTLDADGALQRVLGNTEPATQRRSQIGKASRRWVGYAALGIVLLAASVIGWEGLHSDTHSVKSEAYVTYKTRPGQLASLTLGDGSRVTLGPATIVRAPKAAKSTNAMTVEVDGEVLF